MEKSPSESGLLISLDFKVFLFLMALWNENHVIITILQLINYDYNTNLQMILALIPLLIPQTRE